MILSERLIRNLSQTNIKPTIALEIEGVPFIFGSDTLKKVARYGDEGLDYGDPGVVYGGFVPLPNQYDIISIEGTTTSIKQQLNPDKARGSGISSMVISLIDKNLVATRLVSGQYGEILYKKVKVWVSFGDEADFNDDFILVFRGLIESISSEQGRVKLNLNSPQQQQRQLLLPKADVELDGAIDNSQTTITLNSVENLFQVPAHPLYLSGDPTIKTYVRIEDELIEYTGISGLDLTGCVRGALSTPAVAHDDETQVESFYKLEGNSMDLALKIMLSDADQTPYLENLAISSVNFFEATPIPNIFWINDVDLTRDYNIRIGDYVKSSGFTETANNLTDWTEILDVVVEDTGSYIVVDAVLSDEFLATGELEFLSQYNTLGFGLRLNTDEVDIKRHIDLKGSFLSNFEYRFFIRDEITEGKEFIETQLYLPAACYSLPTDREGLARISIGIHKPPIPGAGFITISKDNVAKPETLSVKRSTNKYYYNVVLIKFEDQPLDEELRRRNFQIAGTSVTGAENKTLVVESFGLKRQFNATTLAQLSSERLLERYATASEFLEGVVLQFRDGVQIVVGDIVIVDPTDLNLINTDNQNRQKRPFLAEVINKDMDIKNGSVKLELVDTAFNIDAKYGLISPSSKVKSVISNTKFVITYINLPSPRYGGAEYRKWNRLNFPGVIIRRADFSETFETFIKAVNLNTIEIQDNPPFTLQEGDIMEFAQYSYVNTRDQQKLVYAYLSDGDNPFYDGEPPYLFI